jgi:hypothetical protein
MGRHYQRWMLLLPAIALLAVFLFGCQVPGRNDAANPNGLALSTPSTRLAQPTPAFPPFTLGAWPSNSTPNASDRIMIFVICRIQDAAASMASTPASGVQVQLHIADPINQTYLGTTQQDGIARVSISFYVARPGLPVLVDAEAAWHGAIYQSQTSFTPAPNGRPSHPSDGGSSDSGHSHPPKPTPTPLPPTPPPSMTPTPKPTAQPTAAP